MSKERTLIAVVALLAATPAAAQPDEEFWHTPGLRLYAADSDFCAQFTAAERFRRSYRRGEDDHDFRIALPERARAVEPERFSEYEYGGTYAYYTFDIDNDGVPDHVVGLHERTHAIDGDAYYVYKTEAPLIPPERIGASEGGSRLKHARSASGTLPRGWEAYPGFGDAAYVATVPANLTSVFRLRYFYLQPFVYEGVTYFRTATLDQRDRDDQLIVRPERDGTLTTLCMFSFERPRYSR